MTVYLSGYHKRVVSPKTARVVSTHNTTPSAGVVAVGSNEAAGLMKFSMGGAGRVIDIASGKRGGAGIIALNLDRQPPAPVPEPDIEYQDELYVEEAIPASMRGKKSRKRKKSAPKKSAKRKSSKKTQPKQKRNNF